jgi:hypothetical protein
MTPCPAVDARTYAYDPIGNRTSATAQIDGPELYYETNELNQYETRDDTSPASTPIDETFSHDLDGNMTVDANAVYTWDAENRLSSVTPGSPVSGSKKLEFKYDYLGRRVEKAVKVYTNSWPTSPTTTERFVYDGWNVVITLSGTTLASKFTWGLDLSGALQGAGGISGLLAWTAGTSGYWYFYDGNGNVTELVSASAATLAVHYEYDSYGNEFHLSDEYSGCDQGGGGEDPPIEEQSLGATLLGSGLEASLLLSGNGCPP